MTHDPLADPLVRAFETATLDPAQFRHEQHLYVAWCYLRALPLEEALGRYVANLRRLTVALGAPEKFHATVTWAYVVLLAAAIERSPDASFEELLRQNPALLDHRSGALYDHYDAQTLATDEARRRFVLPRRA